MKKKNKFISCDCGGQLFKLKGDELELDEIMCFFCGKKYVITYDDCVREETMNKDLFIYKSSIDEAEYFSECDYYNIL